MIYSGKASSPGDPYKGGKEKPVDLPRDQHDILSGGEDHSFVRSVANAQRRNTMTVQLPPAYGQESTEERVRLLRDAVTAYANGNASIKSTIIPPLRPKLAFDVGNAWLRPAHRRSHGTDSTRIDRW